MVFDLFVELKANDEQLDFPIIYASAKNGFAMRELHENSEDMTPLFEAIVQACPAADDLDRAVFPDARLQPALQRLPRPHRLRPHRQRSRGGGRFDRLHSSRWPPRTRQRHRALYLCRPGAGRDEARQRRRHHRPDRFRRGLHRRNADRPRRARRRSSSSTSIRRRSGCGSWSTIRPSPVAKENSSPPATSASGSSAKRAATFPSGERHRSRPALSRSMPAAKCRSRSSSSKCAAKATK